MYVLHLVVGLGQGYFLPGNRFILNSPLWKCKVMRTISQKIWRNYTHIINFPPILVILTFASIPIKVTSVFFCDQVLILFIPPSITLSLFFFYEWKMQHLISFLTPSLFPNTCCKMNLEPLYSLICFSKFNTLSS